jgi:hypothetical protein
VRLRRGDDPVTTLTAADAVEVGDAQIGSMFVTSQTVKATVAPVEGHRARLVLDGQAVTAGWDRADLHFELSRLSRWQRTKLLWAPTLRRVSLRLWRDEEDLRVRIHRWHRGSSATAPS